MNENDEAILKKVRDLAQTERRISTEVLWHLREVERRQIYAKLRYSTLFDFCVKELQYSEGSASRRIRAMRLLKEVNELEDALQTGAVSLTTASQLQSFLQKEKRQQRVYSQEEKRELVRSLQGKSKAETEQFLAGISAESAYSEDRMRYIAEDRIELRVQLDRETFETFERVRSLLSHKIPGSSYREVIAEMARITLAKIDPIRKTDPLAKKREHPFTRFENATQEAPMHIPLAELAQPAVPAGLRREIWRRDEGRCTYVSPKTGHRCDATFLLEVDHKMPRALGGSNEAENLRLLCKAHNILEATRELGEEKMKKHIRRIR